MLQIATPGLMMTASSHGFGLETRSMTKATHQFHRTWIDQCEAAHGIRMQHGMESAFDYIVGEKLFSYAEAALTRPEFARYGHASSAR
jgi:hypothetical protein